MLSLLNTHWQATSRFCPDIRERVERRLAPLTDRQRQYLLATAKLSPLHFATLVVFFSVRQAIVPDHVLGRVTAAVRLIAAGALPLGAALGGVVANIFGLRAPFLLAAVGLAVAVVAGAPNISNANIVGALDETS